MMIDYADYMTDLKQAMSELDSPSCVYRVLRLVHPDVLASVDAQIADGKTLVELVAGE